jgi:hypothetical protein
MKKNDVYFISTDPGTSMFKFSCSHAGKRVSNEVESFFLPVEGGYIGQERFTLQQPNCFAGLVGSPVKDLEPENITRENDLYNTKKFPLGIFFSVADMLDEFNAPRNVTVWIGLALPEAHIGKANAIKKSITGKWTVGKPGGTPREVIIPHVAVTTQPRCVAIDQVFQRQPDNRLNDARGRQLLSGGALHVVLSGSNSLEQFILPAGNFRRGIGHSTFKGTFDLLDDLQRTAYKKTGKNLSQYDLMYGVFKKGLVDIDGDLFDFGSESRQVTSDYISHDGFVKHIESFLNNHSIKPHTCIMAGGTMVYGGQALREALRKKFKVVQVAQDDGNNAEPVYSVRRGLEKYLDSEWEKADV